MSVRGRRAALLAGDVSSLRPGVTVSLGVDRGPWSTSTLCVLLRSMCDCAFY